MSPPDVFSLPIFLVTFRESLETVIIVSVLLAFLKQTVFPQDRTLYKKLVRQVWLGTGAGFLLTLLISAILIGVFYTTGASSWDGPELKYEGAFSLVAAVIISVVGAALLRVGRMREKWAGKLAKSINDYNKDGGGGGGNGGKGAMMMMWRRVKSWTERYFMLVLPFVTVLREGIEAIVFIAGVTFSAPATAVPLAAVVGLAVGAIVGWVLYKGGSSTKLQVFLVISTCLLYLVGAGLFSRAVWSFEQQAWQDIIGGDVTETGDGPGSYDIDKSVWHVNCCNPNMNGGGGWGVLNAIFGWTNSATYGSVISYNLYWLFVIVAFVLMRYREVHGRWPLTKAKGSRRQEDHEAGNRASGEDKASVGKMVATEGIAPVEV